MTHPIDRREALRRAGILLGGVLSASTVAGVLAVDAHAWTGSTDAAWKPRTLSPAQSELVAAIADHIIPPTDTPGARGVGVHRFVDVVLSDHYPARERDRFVAGLGATDQRAREQHGVAFTRCTAAQQLALLTEMDVAAYPPPTQVAQQGAPAVSEASWFWRRMKELTLTGYYTSQVGATQELRAMPWGAYRDIPYRSAGRSWS